MLPVEGPTRRGLALVAISRHGAELARRLAAHPAFARDGVEAWVSARWTEPGSAERSFMPPVRPLVGRLFAERAALVLLMPVGSAVRLLAPLLRDKLADPAVVVVDDAGRFAVSLLSGHAGGANRLAGRVAAALGATSVVTTGSETLGVPVAETLGGAHEWRIEASRADLTHLSAAFVNGEPVGWYQDAGETLPEAGAAGVLPVRALGPQAFEHCAAGVAVTDRLLLPLPAGWVVYRPRTLALGVGCSRGAPADEIEELIRTALLEEALSLAAVRAIGTVDLKRDEPGLLEAAVRLDLPIRFYSTAELAAAGPPPTPSPAVQRHLGIPGVAEPAAVLAADGGVLVARKRKSAMATVAIARRRVDPNAADREDWDA